MNRGASPLLLAMLAMLLPVCGTLAASPAFAQPASTGTVTGLPVPRFVSLRHDKTNVRGGPAQNHEIKWTFAKAGFSPFQAGFSTSVRLCLGTHFSMT